MLDKIDSLQSQEEFSQQKQGQGDLYLFSGFLSEFKQCGFSQGDVQKAEEIVTDKALTVHEQIKLLISFLYELKDRELGKNVEGHILNALSIYLVLGSPSMDQYEALIHFLFDRQEKRIPLPLELEKGAYVPAGYSAHEIAAARECAAAAEEHKSIQQLIQDLLITKAKHLNSAETLNELKRFSAFLEVLKKNYGFGKNEEEAKLVTAVVRRVEDIPYEAQHKRIRFYSDDIELLAFNTKLLFARFVGENDAVEFALRLMKLQKNNKIPFSDVDKKMLLDFLRRGKGLLKFNGDFLRSERQIEVFHFFDSFKNLGSKMGFDDEEINAKIHALFTIISLNARDAGLRSEVSLAKNELAESFTGKNFQEAFEKFDEIYRILQSGGDLKEHPFVDESTNANAMFAVVYDAFNTSKFWSTPNDLSISNVKNSIFSLNQQTDPSKKNAQKFIYYALVQCHINYY